MTYLLVGLIVLGVVGYFGLPHIFTALGMHPHYELPEDLNVLGGRALVISTSHDTLGDTGKKTGVYASEMTAPYYAFLDSGMEVTVASVQGGEIPIDPGSFTWFLISDADKRFQKDETFQKAVKSSVSVTDLNGADFDIVFLTGGWGAAYDMGTSPEVGRVVTEAWNANNVVGGVCHGPLGLLLATDESGEPLPKGRKLTAVSDRQVAQLGIADTPQHPERDLRAAGAEYESSTAFYDLFANHVVRDGRLVTGQNQNGGTETAVIMMRAFEETKKGKDAGSEDN